MFKHHFVKLVFLILFSTCFFTSSICYSLGFYTITDPSLPETSTDVTISRQNMKLSKEGNGYYWHPQTGSNDLQSTTPGVTTYRFNLPQPIVAGDLLVRADTFHWSYSKGHAIIKVSPDGKDWETVKVTPAPAYGAWSNGSWSGKVPQRFFFNKVSQEYIYLETLFVKVILYSYGPRAHEGGQLTNTAQHLRYDIAREGTTFKFDITPKVCHDYTVERVTKKEERLKNLGTSKVAQLRDLLTNKKYKRYPFPKGSNWRQLNGGLADGDVIIVGEKHSGYFSGKTLYNYSQAAPSINRSAELNENTLQSLMNLTRSELPPQPYVNDPVELWRKGGAPLVLPPETPPENEKSIIQSIMMLLFQ